MNGGRDFTKVLLVAVAVLLFMSAYSLYEVFALREEVANLQSQNDFQRLNLANLQASVNDLENQISSLTAHGAGPSYWIWNVCVSVTRACGGAEYYLVVEDNGTTTVPSGYSVSLSFKDATKETFFSFNTTLPGKLAPDQGVTIVGSTWPEDSGALSKLAQGDQVGVAVSMGSFETSVAAHVLSCTPVYSTTTYVNYTETMTITSTGQTCT